MIAFAGRLFAGRLFAGQLFRGARQEQNAGGYDHRWLAHAPARWKQALSRKVLEQAEAEPPEVILAIEQMAQKVETTEPVAIGRQLAKRGLEPTSKLYVDIYLQFLALRLQREEEAAIAACIAALV